MLLADAAIQLRHLIDDGAIKHLEETQIVGLIRLLQQLVEDGGPLPQLAPTISGGIEVQWLVGADFVGLIVDRGVVLFRQHSGEGCRDVGHADPVQWSTRPHVLEMFK